jgi:hypothetical protein
LPIKRVSIGLTIYFSTLTFFNLEAIDIFLYNWILAV